MWKIFKRNRHRLSNQLDIKLALGEEQKRSTYVAVLLLDELEEGWHVRTAEVVDGLQAGEHAAAVEALEVVLADVLKSNRLDLKTLLLI